MGGESEHLWTRLRIPWPDWPSPEFTLQFSVHNLGSALGEMVGVGDMQVGDPLFDNRYDIHLSAPAYLHAILNPQARALATRLADTPHYNDLVWKIEYGTMTLLKHADLIAYDDLTGFVRLSLELRAAALAEYFQAK